MMAELAEIEAVYSLMPWIKISQFSIDCVVGFGCRKGKNGNLVVPSSELYPVSKWEEKKLFLGQTTLITLYGGPRLE